jgi:hypothetical protein
MKLSIFTTPKPFNKNNIVSQTNCLLSCKQLSCNKNIHIYGEENDFLGKELAGKLNITWTSDYKKAPSGAPFLNDLIYNAISRVPDADFYIYTNCDIVYLDGLEYALNALKKRNLKLPIFGCGQRWDTSSLNYLLNWKTIDKLSLINFVKDNGNLHSASGVDYFIFQKTTFQSMPDLIVARATYDNLIVGHAITNSNISDWDLTNKIFAVHQNHDYLVNGSSKPHNQFEEFYREEFEFNRRRHPFGWNEMATIDMCKNRLN